MTPPAFSLRATDWPHIAAGFIFAGVALLVVLTFADYGVSWDEEVQNTYGTKLLALYASGFHDRSALNYINLFFYGGFFDLLAAAANTVSPFGMFETRHLLGGILMLAGLLGCWRLTHLLAGPRAALIAVALCATAPLLYGHSFINPKDAPFAWLSIWVSYYACRCLDDRRTAIGLAISLGLALGTKIFALAYLGYFALVLGVMTTARGEDGSVAQVWRVARPVLFALPLAYAVMTVFWPWGATAPLHPLAALSEFLNFPWKASILWNGEMVPSEHLPAAYLAVLLAYQLPEAVLAGVVIAVCVAGVAVWRGRLSCFAQPAAARHLYLGLSILVPLTAFVVLRPTVYNGLRHFLFVVPPLCIAAAIGFNWLLDRAARHGRYPAVFAAAVIVLALAHNVALMVDLHPDEYVAFNTFAGGMGGAAGRFELDYWGTSLAEASRKLTVFIDKDRAAPRSPLVFVCAGKMSALYFLPPRVRITYEENKADFYIAIVSPACHRHADAADPLIADVRKDGIPLSYVLDLRGANRTVTAAAAHSQPTTNPTSAAPSTMR